MRTQSKTILKALSSEVRRLRESAGLSQGKLAGMARVHVNVIGRLERGSYNPTITTLVSIAAALDTTLSEILAPKETAKRARLKAV